MPLAEGTKLGPYQIAEPIGAGGMGEVYRARDTELERDVAIKVLPESFAGDPERLARFEREAKLLASLNHPNIASIYGLERAGNDRALVMELIEGPTLAERIAEGPIPIDDAYELAERISGTELEKWQVLEPTLAEFLGTHLPAGGTSEPTTSDEDELGPDVRNAVFDRDEWCCKFPGCTMRKMLDPHHIVFRSHQGDDDAGNMITLCRIHHDLIHRGICTVTGTVGVDLRCERPQLVTESKSAAPAAPEVESEKTLQASQADPADPAENDESWRDEVVADIFDGPPAHQYEPPIEDYNDFMNHWIAQKKARDLEYRAKARRAGREQVCAYEHVCAGARNSDAPTLDAGGGPESG